MGKHRPGTKGSGFGRRSIWARAACSACTRSWWDSRGWSQPQHLGARLAGEVTPSGTGREPLSVANKVHYRIGFRIFTDLRVDVAEVIDEKPREPSCMMRERGRFFPSTSNVRKQLQSNGWLQRLPVTCCSWQLATGHCLAGGGGGRVAHSNEVRVVCGRWRNAYLDARGRSGHTSSESALLLSVRVP